MSRKEELGGGDPAASTTGDSAPDGVAPTLPDEVRRQPEGGFVEETDPEPTFNWATLPDCPDVIAVRSTAEFFVLIAGTDEDWKLPVERRGLAWFGSIEPSDRCRAYALSVFTDRSDIERIAKFSRFKDHQIMKFRMRLEWGDLNCNKNSHHSWWPSAQFVPPPDPMWVA